MDVPTEAAAGETTCWNGAKAGELGDGRRSFVFGRFHPLFLYVPPSFLSALGGT